MRKRTPMGWLIAGCTALVLLLGGSLAYWYSHPRALAVSVGPEGSTDQRFAVALNHTLHETRASVQLSIHPHPTAALALADFSHRKADLAVIRTDSPLPPQARAVAVLEEEVLLLISRPDTPFDSPSDLKGKRLAVLGEDGRNEALVRQILDYYEIEPSATSTVIHTLPPNTPMDGLLNGDYDFVVSLEPLSRLSKTSGFEHLAQRMGGFAVHGLVDARALQRRISGLVEETLETGLLSAEPEIPANDLDTVAVQDVLVARSGIGEPTVAELASTVFENRNELAIDRRFATDIEPPDLDKDAMIAAHAGAAQYLQGEVRGFVDQYSDLLYLLMSVGSILGSVGLAVMSSLRRHHPVGADDRTGELLEIANRIRDAASPQDLDQAEAAMEKIYEDVVLGLHHGRLSGRGLETFRMAYDHIHRMLESRRRNDGGVPQS